MKNIMINIQDLFRGLQESGVGGIGNNVGSGGNVPNIGGGIGIAVIGGFLGYIFLVTLQPPEQNSEALINLVLGYLGGLASAIISFYFGASNTSDKKD